MHHPGETRRGNAESRRCEEPTGRANATPNDKLREPVARMANGSALSAAR
jgi:hypothetical protein